MGALAIEQGSIATPAISTMLFNFLLILKLSASSLLLIVVLQAGYVWARLPKASFALPYFLFFLLLGTLVIPLDVARESFSRYQASFTIAEIALLLFQCTATLAIARYVPKILFLLHQIGALETTNLDVAAVLAHDLRAPNANIQMSIKMFELMPDRESHYLKIIKAECVRQQDIIEDILTLARLERGLGEASLQRTLVEEEIESLAGLIGAAHDKPITLNLPTLRRVCNVDTTKVKRVISELLTNACKYTPENGSVRVFYQVLHGEMGRFTIINSAEIPSEHLASIYDRFYRVEAMNINQAGGTGLGLAIVKQLAAILNGSIAVKSAQGETRFIFEFPVQED